MKKVLFLALMIITACAPLNETRTSASFFEQTPVPANLTLDSTSGQIQQAMLQNAIQWKTLHMDGQATWFEAGVPIYAMHEEVWLDPVNSRYKTAWTGILNNMEKILK